MSCNWHVIKSNKLLILTTFEKDFLGECYEMKHTLSKEPRIALYDVIISQNSNKLLKTKEVYTKIP